MRTLDDGADDAGIFVGEIQDGADAEEDARFFQVGQFAFHLGGGEIEHLGHLGGVQAAAFEHQFDDGLHLEGECRRFGGQIHIKLRICASGMGVYRMGDVTKWTSIEVDRSPGRIILIS